MPMKAVACAIAMMARRSERNLFIVIILYYVRYILVDYYLLWYNLLMLPSLPVASGMCVDGCCDRRENCGSARIDVAQRSTSVRPYCLLRDKSQPGKN